MPYSKSEENGLKLLGPQDLKVYSVGVSTGGNAEIRMIKNQPSRSVTATTIDKKGFELTVEKVREVELKDKITVKLENVAELLPYENASFDFVYARLILHYLGKQELQNALKELYRILRKEGRILVIVRSVNCYSATQEEAV